MRKTRRHAALRTNTMIWAAASGVMCPIWLSAQEPSARAFIDSIVSETPNGADGVPPTCAGHIVSVDRLCEGLVSVYEARLAPNRDVTRHAEQLLTRTVEEQPRWAAGWYGLGLARLQLARDTVFSSGGPLLPLGSSYVLGAINALVRALELDSTFGAAAIALATAPIPREGASAVRNRLAVLRRTRSVLSPGATAAAALLERESGYADSALALEQRALTSGVVDSGLVLLSMARDLYRAGHPSVGRKALLAGAGVGSAQARAAYRAEIAWVATPKELLVWDSLGAAERAPWLADFWEKRDVAEGRADGERLIEHYRRLEYAMRHFRITLPQVGRQTFLSSTPTMGYYWEEQAKKCAIRNPDKYPDLARVDMLSRSVGTDASQRYYHPIQDEIDDRGIVWIRHGKPDAVAADASGDPIEVWLYHQASGPLLLQFRGTDFEGSTGASVLVPTLLTLSLGMRNRICHLDTSLCGRLSTRSEPIDASGPSASPRGSCTGPAAAIASKLNSEIHAEGSALSPEAIMRARDSGRAEIASATTSDTYRRTFARPIHPSVQILGLDGANGGAPRLVIAFAIPGEELSSRTSSSASGRTVYPVRIQVMTSRVSDARRADLDTLRQFAAGSRLQKGQMVVGMLEFPITAGAYRVSVVFTQPDSGGAVAKLAEVVVPGTAGRLTVSDLVLGRDSSGVHWYSGTTAVALNPLNAYPDGGNADVYVQLSGLIPGNNYQSKFEFYRASDGPKAGPRLALSVSQRATDARMEISRVLGLQNLKVGQYRLKLTVSGDGQESNAVAWLTIVK